MMIIISRGKNRVFLVRVRTQSAVAASISADWNAENLCRCLIVLEHLNAGRFRVDLKCGRVRILFETTVNATSEWVSRDACNITMMGALHRTLTSLSPRASGSSPRTWCWCCAASRSAPFAVQSDSSESAASSGTAQWRADRVPDVLAEGLDVIVQQRSSERDADTQTGYIS